MKIIEIDDLHQWQSFCDEAGSPSFLQSWEWGEFEKRSGYRVKRLGLLEQKKLIATAQIIEIKSKRGNFLFVPHGPIIKLQTNEPDRRSVHGPVPKNGSGSRVTNDKLQIKEIIAELLNYLITLARKDDFSFIRIAPILENTDDNKKIFSDLGFKKAPIYMHAERVWILPLTKTLLVDSAVRSYTTLKSEQYFNDEELLTKMRKTTRYSIKRAARDRVIIKKRVDEEALDNFMQIYKTTAERENFVPFSRSFIKHEFESFHKTGNAMFFEATHPQGVLASALIIFTKSTAFYHQGASIHSKIPAPYLLQWEAIREAKRRGCAFYNFWGILQEGRTPKAWGGLTLFKQGFGGKEIDYVPTQDYILSPKYYLTYAYETYLNWRRGV